MKHWNRYLSGCFTFLFMVFFAFCTDHSVVDCEKRNLKEMSSRKKKISVIANAGLISIAIATQIIIWNWNYNIKHSYPLFVLSNIIMGAVYIYMLCENMYHAVGNYDYIYASKEFTYVIAGFFHTYVKSNSYGDNWLYHLYFNAIIYICAMEIIVLSTGNVWLNIADGSGGRTDVSNYLNDEDFEYISSDEEYDMVDENIQSYHESEAISL